ncbi:MAG TPA: imidazole glycerol phosphate synthase subunit HisH [Gaiellales bacterium]|jgi:glutamine amidotransferase
MADSRVALVDYGAGNLRSLRAAFARGGLEPVVTADPTVIAAATLVVIPGVGAARPAMEAIRAAGLDEAIAAAVDAGAHLFGVCVGLQLLFQHSEEDDVDCLGLLPGTVQRLVGARRLPHMGWNDVAPVNGHPLAAPFPAAAYFAHSYAVLDAPDEIVLARTSTEGGPFASLVGRGPIAAAQFHPERSSEAGRQTLAAVLAWAGVA